MSGLSGAVRVVSTVGRRNSWWRVSGRELPPMGMKITMGTDNWACINKDCAMEPECEGADITV